MRGHHIGKTTDPVEGCSYSSKYNVDLLVLGYIWYSRSTEEWNVSIAKGASSVAIRVNDSLAETPDKVLYL